MTSAEELQSKWLYVVLAWVYSTRAQLRDPLQVVEQIYDDWGYPEDVAGLVRYMPSDGPVSAAPAERDRTLIAHWKRYLDAAARRYAPVEAVP